MAASRARRSSERGRSRRAPAAALRAPADARTRRSRARNVVQALGRVEHGHAQAEAAHISRVVGFVEAPPSASTRSGRAGRFPPPASWLTGGYGPRADPRPMAEFLPGIRSRREMGDGHELARRGHQHGKLIGAEVHRDDPAGRLRPRRPLRKAPQAAPRPPRRRRARPNTPPARPSRAARAPPRGGPRAARRFQKLARSPRIGSSVPARHNASTSLYSASKRFSTRP